MRRVMTVAAGLLLLLVLLMPDEYGLLLTPAAFARVPADGLLAVTLVLVIPPRSRPLAVGVAGTALGVLAVLKLVGIGFSAILGRPFDPVMDWSFLRASFGFLSRSIGGGPAIAVTIATIVFALGLIVLVALAFRRVTRVVLRDQSRSAKAVATFACAWVACVVTGAQVIPHLPLAGHDYYDRVLQVRDGLLDRQIFAAQSKVDAYRDHPHLLESLRGKDVIVAFVESYGRVALDDPVLQAPAQRLRRAGFALRSAFLTSPTVGGGSWLAQATLLSGLWVNSHQRYRALVEGDRFTLNQAFDRAGWRTVAVMPANTTAWPEGSFYGYDRIYEAADLSYRGPKFSFDTVPDQFTLAQFHRSERMAPHAPVMATIPLISSHAPWRPVPQPLDWASLGDGSEFAIAAESGEDGQKALAGDRSQVRADYRDAIGYSVSSLVSYVEHYGGHDLVVVLLGDHQPAPIVTGTGAGRDVPITIIARDPKVVSHLEDWGWHDGLTPAPRAPVWRMDAFRDRFLAAFSG